MASERRKKELVEQILILLEESGTNYLTQKEIATILITKKHEYKTLNDILNQLKRDKRVLVKSGKFGALPSSTLPQTITGIFDATSLVKGYSYAFVLHPDGDILIDSEDMNNAFHNDEVQVKLKYKKRGLLYGVITKVLKRANEKFTGNIEFYRDRYYFLPDLGKIDSLFEVKDLAGATRGDKVVLKVEDWGDSSSARRPSGKVIEILGRAGDYNTETLAIIRQFDLPLDFPQSVISEVENIDDSISSEEISRRLDLRDLPTITIDPESAKDYDDAISIIKTNNHYDVYVHIADVSQYVRVDCELFKEAFERGNSFYFARQVIPMIPTKISNGICSLRPDEDKLTLTVKTVFDANLKIIEQSISESIIRSKARLTYEQVDAYLEGREHQVPEEILPLLDELHLVSKALYQRRYHKGYIPFNMPEIEFVYSEDGKVVDLKQVVETESHKIVENCMLIANEYVATRLNTLSDSGMYRVHELPEEEAIERIVQLLKFYRVEPKGKNLKGQKYIQSLLEAMPNSDYHRVFDPFLLRSMKKARYDTLPIGHFGLATKYYTHFTSPIRRICDLTVHHLLKQYLWSHETQKRLAENELKKIAEKASEREVVADTVEREVSYRFKKLFMADKLGEVYNGMIVNITNGNIIVEIEGLPVTGVIPVTSLTDDKYKFYQMYMELIGKQTGKVYKLMDRVKVKIIRIEYDIIFSLLEDRNNMSAPKRMKRKG